MDKVLSGLRKNAGNELVSGSFFLFAGGLIGSFLSFAYNLYLARSLTQADYGTYTSLLSFEALITIPSASLTAIIVRFATHYFSEKQDGKAIHLFQRMSVVWLAIGAAIFFLILILSPIILNYLHLSDPKLIFMVALGVGIAYAGVVNSGFLQSLLKFPFIAVTSVVGSLSKVLVGGAFVFAGFGALGGLAGVVMLPLSIYLISFWPLRHLIRKKSSQEEHIETREMITYGLFTSLGIISLSSLISTDVILVKHFFTETQAGLYGGLSIIGKVIFYFTAAIPSVMFPLVVKRHARGENYKSIYLLAMVLVFLPSLAITIFYFLLPLFTVNLFLGKNYLSVAPYLALFGVFITLFNLVSVTVSFFLSLKKTKIAYLVFVFAVLQIILIYLFHSNFYHVILSSIISLVLLLFSLLLYYKLQKD